MTPTSKRLHLQERVDGHKHRTFVVVLTLCSLFQLNVTTCTLQVASGTSLFQKRPGNYMYQFLYLCAV